MNATRYLVLGSIVALAFAVSEAQEATPPPAATKTPVVKQRERNQARRIHQGVKSGEVTKKEAGTLRKEQAKIHRDEAKAKKDGTVTPQERAKLQKEQNAASRDIARKKHNARTR